MSFEPLGYRFEVKSRRSPADVKTAIRSRKKKWLDMKNGARGWIAGPFICLWFSATNSLGPMLFGVISSDGAGTRLHGRAGSDLNGVVACSLSIPLMVFVTYQMIVDGPASVRQLLVFAAFLLVGIPLVYWIAHKNRRQAEPLVRFLRDILEDSGRSHRRNSGAVMISKGFTLSVGGEKLVGAVKPESIHDALIGLGESDFLVLESSLETYIQTASHDGKYIVEKQEGSGRKHFRAARRSGDTTQAAHSRYIFDFEEVSDIFLAYASADPTPDLVTWERFDPQK